jgi:hypothetical protein
VTDRTDAGRNQAAIRQDADSDGEIDAILEQVENPVAEQKPRIDIGICN